MAYGGVFIIWIGVFYENGDAVYEAYGIGGTVHNFGFVNMNAIPCIFHILIATIFCFASEPIGQKYG